MPTYFHFPQLAFRLSGLLLIGVVLVACSNEPDNPAEAIYFGGDILTMAGDEPQYAEALVVNDGQFAYIGSKLEADKLAGKATQQVDLKGTTLIPSVIPGVQQALTSQGATSAPNCWKDTTFNSSSDVIKALNMALVARAKLGLGLFCMGYKFNASDGLQGLTEADLDAAFPEVSVVLVDAALQNVLANSIAKKQFSLETYTSLKNAMRKTDAQIVGLHVGQPADFMILDKNPLKDPSVSLASVQITQAFSKGEPIPSAPKDLAILALLDLSSAIAAENTANLTMAQSNAAAQAIATAKATAKKTESSAKAEKIAADKKVLVAKAKVKVSTAVKVDALPNSNAIAEADAKQAAKRSNAKTDIVRKPIVVETLVATDATKPKEVRFNMTQDGKKMTPEDFDAWMKAQGIRIVPAKPAVIVPPVESK